MVKGVSAVESFAAFLRDRRGATALEYALIAGLVSVVILAGLTGTGKSLNTKFYGPVSNGLS